jgi:uncharacterized lipoprotein YddW (UPF0748 family)
MKTSYYLPVALLLFMVSVSGVSQLLPKREFRGVWLTTVGNGDWPSAYGLPVQTQKNELTTFLDKLKAVGINVVFLQVRPECDAFYQSSIEPWSYWLTGSQGLAPSPLYDPLAFAVIEAHKRGMELHAWFNPYRAVRSGSTYTKAANHITNTHPDWLMTIGSTVIMDPGRQVVRQYVLNVIDDVVRRYDIDGVVMDDYFYEEGITTQDAATFASESRGFTNLADWRRDNVNLLIHGIHDSVSSIKPWVKYGMSPRGIWKNGVPPGIIGNDNYSSIYCDAVAWLTGQYIDYFSPQLYWKIGGSQSYILLEPWWASQCNGRIFCPSLAAYRIGQTAYGGAAEVANQIRYYRNAGNAHGNVPFTANNLTNNLGGIGDTLKNDIYRYPALVVQFPWKDTLRPNPPRGIQYAAAGGSGAAAITWELPITAADGDSASRYAIYRFNHPPSLPLELDSSKNLLALTGQRVYTPATPPVSGTYSYVVTALDRNWSESEPSTVLQIGPPATPILATPLNGTTSVAESVLVTWHGVLQASSYHLQVASDSTFGSGLLVNDSTLTDTVKLVKGYAGQVFTYWRIRARNASGNSEFTSRFTFVCGVPAVAILASPGNVAVDQPVFVPLKWYATPTATSFRLQLALNAAFSPVVLDTAWVADTSLVSPALEFYKIYFWRVKSRNAIGESAWTSYYRFRTVQASSVEQQPGTPTEFALSQNFPNPFNPTTMISFSVASPPAGRQVASHVKIVVFDLLGREVSVLLDESLEPGTYQMRFDASHLPSGVYFYRMTAGQFVATKRMLIVK